MSDFKRTTLGRYLADEDPRADEELADRVARCSRCGEVDGCACDEAPACEITGLATDECDCPDCYFERHEEPKPCPSCGGVGGHMTGCV